MVEAASTAPPALVPRLRCGCCLTASPAERTVVLQPARAHLRFALVRSAHLQLQAPRPPSRQPSAPLNRLAASSSARPCAGSPPRAPLRCAPRIRDSRLRLHAVMLRLHAVMLWLHAVMLWRYQPAVMLWLHAVMLRLHAVAQAPRRYARQPSARLISPAASGSAKRCDGSPPRAPLRCAPVCSAHPRFPAPRLLTFGGGGVSPPAPVHPLAVSRSAKFQFGLPPRGPSASSPVRSARPVSTGSATPAWRPSAPVLHLVPHSVPGTFLVS